MSDDSKTDKKPKASTDSPRVWRYVSEDMSFRVSAVNSTEVVEKMRQIQHTSPIATMALGRAMTGAMLMASQLKEGQQISLDFKGSGPLQRVFAHGTFEGAIRGYVSQPQIEFDDTVPFSVGPYMGEGFLTVSSFKPQSKIPYRGTFDLVSGEIAEDIAYYYQQSHQIPTLISIGVHLSEYGMVDGAGGVLIQLMPGTPNEIINHFENAAKEVSDLSEKLADGIEPHELAKLFTKSLKIRELPHPHPSEYSCPCTKERLMRSMNLLGLEEIERSISEGESIDSQCQMCGEKYTVSIEDLEQLRDDLKKKSYH